MPRVITKDTFDFGDIAVLEAGWDLSISQLESAAQASSFRLIEANRVSLSSMFYRVSVVQRASAKSGYVNFGLPATNSTPIWVGDQPITPEKLVLFPDESMQATSISRAGFSATAIHLEREHVEGVLDLVFHRTLAEMYRYTGANHLQPDDQAVLRQALTSWNCLLTSKQIVTDNLLRKQEDALVQLLLTCLFRCKAEVRPRLPKSERAMKLALDFIHHAALDEVSVAMLCDVTGCGISALEYSFKRRFGVTPKRYIKSLQLSRTRDSLIRFDEDEYKSIADLANKQGFWHMGQFAADYRRLFGELPSETLARCRT